MPTPATIISMKDELRGIVEVACWAHVRRKFFDAQSSDLMRSTVMLAYIRLLYDIEREARDRKLDSAGRRALRQEKAKPILADMRAYREREQHQVLPKSPEGQAIAYTLSNWQALVRYCEDGDLEIDNNGAERSLRGVAVGRKNWMFLRQRQRGTHRRRADQPHRYLQAAPRRSVRLLARSLRTHQRSSPEPPGRITSRSMESRDLILCPQVTPSCLASLAR